MPEMNPLPDANVRSQTYYVARTSLRCWHCGMSTRLLALAMPQDHETLDADTQGEVEVVAGAGAEVEGEVEAGAGTETGADAEVGVENEVETDAEGHDESAPDDWQRANLNAFIFYVQHLPDDVQDRLSQLSQFFRLAHSDATQNSYWANHCEHCGTLLGDHELYCEPDGAFLPSSEAAAAGIQLLQIPEPFEAAAAGYAFEPEFFRFMRKG
jgi:hypothetical protein